MDCRYHGILFSGPEFDYCVANLTELALCDGNFTDYDRTSRVRTLEERLHIHIPCLKAAVMK